MSATRLTTWPPASRPIHTRRPVPQARAVLHHVGAALRVFCPPGGCDRAVVQQRRSLRLVPSRQCLPACGVKERSHAAVNAEPEEIPGRQHPGILPGPERHLPGHGGLITDQHADRSYQLMHDRMPVVGFPVLRLVAGRTDAHRIVAWRHRDGERLGILVQQARVHRDNAAGGQPQRPASLGSLTVTSCPSCPLRGPWRSRAPTANSASMFRGLTAVGGVHPDPAAPVPDRPTTQRRIPPLAGRSPGRTVRDPHKTTSHRTAPCRLCAVHRGCEG